MLPAGRTTLAPRRCRDASCRRKPASRGCFNEAAARWIPASAGMTPFSLWCGTVSKRMALALKFQSWSLQCRTDSRAKKAPTCCSTPTTRWTGTPGRTRPSPVPRPRTNRSSCPSATPPATGATSWSGSRSRTRRSRASLNAAFVCIKVDREERPDIDAVYMTACQMMTGGGGWPLTIFMTPDRQPFFAATYLPRRDPLRPPGADRALRARARALGAGTAARGRLGRRHRREPRPRLRLRPGRGAGTAAARPRLRRHRLRLRRAPRRLRPAPKFPTPHHLLFLLRVHDRTGDARGARDGRAHAHRHAPGRHLRPRRTTGSTATRPTPSGSSRTSRRCSTTRP